MPLAGPGLEAWELDHAPDFIGADLALAETELELVEAASQDWRGALDPGMGQAVGALAWELAEGADSIPAELLAAAEEVNANLISAIDAAPGETWVALPAPFVPGPDRDPDEPPPDGVKE